MYIHISQEYVLSLRKRNIVYSLYFKYKTIKAEEFVSMTSCLLSDVT